MAAAADPVILLIGGSRDTTGLTYKQFVKAMDEHLKRQDGGLPSLVISGGAKGIDTYAKQWAMERAIPYEEIAPQWSKYGRRAGLLRNTTLVDKATHVLLFWNGKSNGTRDTRDKAMKAGKLTHVHMFGNWC